VVSAIVFLSGAGVVEMIGGAIAEAEGGESSRYRLMANIEEGAELAGVRIFSYALVAYRQLPSVVPERRPEDLRSAGYAAGRFRPALRCVRDSLDAAPTAARSV